MATPLRTVPGSNGDPLAEAIELTRRLKLPHIRRALTDLIPTAKAQRWDPAEVVRVLLAEEAAGRDASNLRTRRKRVGFPAGKTFGDWDETASSISRQVQESLKTLEWISRKENLCVCGPSGTGKSHFTEALGQAAVEAGMTVSWFAIEDHGALIRRHCVDDSLARAMTRLIRSDLIIVDDIGLLPISADAAEGFLRLVDAAYERRAMAVSSNLHPSGFDEIMPKTLATATVDRLLHHAHVVVTQGDSFRLTEATSGKGVRPLN
ncbi:IS21-like element helper ATPase IstB [Streptomyces antibioticus]|uniref:IS21-like element helper ATPase IstB n=1 Tax=Streptomyces antibioticus TaxID=1890 RepID=UPI0033ABCB60